MSLIRFDYIADLVIDPSTKKETGRIYRPKIPIRLCYGHNMAKFLVDCLIDSGSDNNLFPAEWGEVLGIKIQKGKQTSIYGIGNIKIISYCHKVKLYMGTVSIFTEANFIYEQNIPLLGRNGFFNCFKRIIFNDKDRFVELEL